MLLRSSGRRLALAVVVVSVLGVVFGAASLADSYSVPSGAWTLNATGHGRYDGLRKWRSRSYGYLPASIRLTPVCPQLTCATNASITLRNGRTVAFKLRYTALEYTHDTGMVTFRGRFCSRRAKINFFLGASMVADDNGQPKALAAMARALIYDAGCRPPAGSNAIVRMRGTLIPTPTGQAGR
jgi:hypothetical protein